MIKLNYEFKIFAQLLKVNQIESKQVSSIKSIEKWVFWNPVLRQIVMIYIIIYISRRWQAPEAMISRGQGVVCKIPSHARLIYVVYYRTSPRIVVYNVYQSLAHSAYRLKKAAGRPSAACDDRVPCVQPREGEADLVIDALLVKCA